MTEAATEGYNVPRGAAYLTSQQVVVYATSFIFYIILARILTRAEIGQVSLLAGTMAVFNAVTLLALPTTATRYISSSLARRQPETAGAIARTILRLTLVIAGVGTVVAILLSPLIAKPVFDTSDATPLIATFVSGFFLDFILLYGAYFLGAGLYAKTVLQNIVYIPLSRGLGLLLAYTGLRVLGIILGWAIGGVATVLISVYQWRNRVPKASSHPIRPLLVFTLPLFASSLIILGQQWGDVYLLQALLGQLGTTGAYYIIVSSVGFLSILWLPVSSALYPALSASHSTGGPTEVSQRLAFALRLTNLAIFPLAAALAALAPTALEIAYGPSYVGEALPFAILALSTIFAAQGALLTITLQAVGKTRSFLQITFAATVVDLATVGLTAQALGQVGGAIGRALLALGIVILARRALHPTVSTTVRRGMLQGLLLAIGVSLPLLLVDQLLILYSVRAIVRLPVLALVFAGTFLPVARTSHIFHPGDFTILKDALPRRLHPYLRTIERLIINPPKTGG